jgi:ankyrin repeat protein
MQTTTVPDLGNFHNAQGQTALHYASANGGFDVAALLLSNGADIDQNAGNPGEELVTPITLAALAGHGDIVHLLIENGADYRITDGTNRTLISQIASMSAHDISIGHVEVVEKLLAAGLRVDGKKSDDIDVSAMKLAAFSRNLQIALVLLRHGANPAEPDSSGRNCLHWGAIMGHTQIVNMALEAGVDPMSQDKAGFTAMHFAATGGFVAVMDELWYAKPSPKGAWFRLQVSTEIPLYTAQDRNFLLQNGWLNTGPA